MQLLTALVFYSHESPWSLLYDWCLPFVTTSFHSIFSWVNSTDRQFNQNLPTLRFIFLSPHHVQIVIMQILEMFLQLLCNLLKLITKINCHLRIEPKRMWKTVISPDFFPEPDPWCTCSMLPNNIVIVLPYFICLVWFEFVSLLVACLVSRRCLRVYSLFSLLIVCAHIWKLKYCTNIV